MTRILKPKKTDNRSLHSKLALRRWVLERMGLTSIRVLDVCSGAGHIWAGMEPYVDIKAWVKIDIKPRSAGTIKMTAVQAIQNFPLEDFDVLDIDTYGEPWEAYRVALARLQRPMAIFLTHGHTISLNVSFGTAQAEGIPKAWVTQRDSSAWATYLPQTPEVGLYLAERSLRSTWRYAEVRAAAQVALRKVTYYGLALAPLPHAAPPPTPRP